ncbi:MAG: prepilin-type N-terminal cleavage/methylation domain-containing protein [Gammaproteobacteria bacterium]|nr:prepilin-type N-terminal cleavage/methylation domain-containing protein [Gammaproteobacteria bacterium]
MIRKIRGVTLVELMIVVIVVGILAAFAYPNYRDYLSRSKRNEAKAALLQIATNQERWYLNNNSYTANLADVGVAAVTGSGAYAIAINAADANDFTATATYLIGDAEAGRCLTFTIDGRGQRTSAPDADCWTRTR